MKNKASITVLTSIGVVQIFYEYNEATKEVVIDKAFKQIADSTYKSMEVESITLEDLIQIQEMVEINHSK